MRNITARCDRKDCDVELDLTDIFPTIRYIDPFGLLIDLDLCHDHVVEFMDTYALNTHAERR